MAELTVSVAKAIAEGQGATAWEIYQLARAFLHEHGMESPPYVEPAALSHDAGQDGEQCRAASGNTPSVAEQIELAKQVAPWFIAALGDLTQDYASMTVEDVELALRANGEYALPVFRALSRGVAEDTRRMDWLVANVTEKLTAKSIQGEFPYPEHKTQYVLPRLIAWADFHGQVGFREAIDYAIADQRKEGE